MIHQIIPAHPGLTAIAAVLAMTATPAFAQVATPEPSVTQAPPAAEPAAPASAEPAATTPVKAVPTLPDLPVASADKPAQAVAESRLAKPAPIKPAPIKNAEHIVTSAVRSGKPTLSMPAFTPAPPPVVADDISSPVMPAQSKMTVVPIVRPSNSSGGMAGISDNRVTETNWLLLGGGGLLMAAAGTAFALSRRRKVANASPARPSAMLITPAPVRAAAPAPRVDARNADHSVVQPVLEALIAQSPSPANPFSTRRNRLRRAHYLLRTGQARAEVPANAARTMAERPAAFAPDRWSETRVAGQTPMWVNWQPSKR